MAQVGDNIKRARINSGVSQEELARVIGATKSTISKYELGHREPSLNTIQRIADALAVDFLDLVEISGDTKAVNHILKSAEDGKKAGKRIVWRDNNLHMVELSPSEKILIATKKLNAEGLREAVKRIEELTEIPRYRRQEIADDTQEAFTSPNDE